MGHYKGYCQPLNILSGQALVPLNQPVNLDTGEPMEAEQADVQPQSVSAPQDTDTEMLDKSVESSSSSSSSSTGKSVAKDDSKDTLESEKSSDTEATQEESQEEN